jgi:hypothetical protein
MATDTISHFDQPGLTDLTGQFLNASNANVGASFNIPAVDDIGNYGITATVPSGALPGVGGQLKISSVTSGFSLTSPVVIDGAGAGAGGGGTIGHIGVNNT